MMLLGDLVLELISPRVHKYMSVNHWELDFASAQLKPYKYMTLIHLGFFDFGVTLCFSNLLFHLPIFDDFCNAYFKKNKIVLFYLISQFVHIIFLRVSENSKIVKMLPKLFRTYIVFSF